MSVEQVSIDVLEGPSLTPGVQFLAGGSPLPLPEGSEIGVKRLHPNTLDEVLPPSMERLVAKAGISPLGGQKLGVMFLSKVYISLSVSPETHLACESPPKDGTGQRLRMIHDVPPKEACPFVIAPRGKGTQRSRFLSLRAML